MQIPIEFGDVTNSSAAYPRNLHIRVGRGVFVDGTPPLGEKAAGCTFFPLEATRVYLILNEFDCN